MTNSLNTAQRTLLELLAEPLNDAELEQLRTTLVQFRYQRLQKMLNQQWEEKGWTQATLDQWYKEHNRTPYRSQPAANS